MKPSPSFRRPPVTEVAIAAQFGEIRGLTGPHMGLLWQRYRDSFPKLEVHPALGPRFERSGPAQGRDLPSSSIESLRLARGSSGATKHTWFKSNRTDSSSIGAGSRATTTPGISMCGPRLRRTLASSRSSSRTSGWVSPRLNQWELTYVNHIPSGDGWHRHGELDSVIPMLAQSVEGAFLPKPEDIALQVRYRMPDGKGAVSRLYVVANPGFDESGKPVLGLTLTARGGLGQGAAEALLSRLDVGREWIVRGFAEVTSKTMHRLWEREQ